MRNRNSNQDCSCMVNPCIDNIEDCLLEDDCNLETYESNYDSCACGFDEGENQFPACPMYGQSYVPIQYMDKTFKPSIGLEMGTIFPELVSPYSPCQSMEEINYIKETNTIGKGCNSWN